MLLSSFSNSCFSMFSLFFFFFFFFFFFSSFYLLSFKSALQHTVAAELYMTHLDGKGRRDCLLGAVFQVV